MQTIDVNVLVNAFRPDSVNHAAAQIWLDGARRSPSPFAIPEFVFSAFVRVVTNRRAFADPAPLQSALDFCVALASQRCAELLLEAGEEALLDARDIGVGERTVRVWRR